MLDNLIPISNTHSLRQVACTVFCQSPLIEPNRFTNLRDNLGYQKFELINQKTLSLSVNQDRVQNDSLPSKEVGFRMVAYNEGRLQKILHVEQKELDGKDFTVVNYQSLKYPHWEVFLNDVLKDFEALSVEDNPFITAVALQYSNEFLWNSEEDIEIAKVFNRDADFMSNKFFLSQNSSFLINTEDYKEGYKSIEHLEISVSKERKVINTNSQLVFELVKPLKFHDSINNKDLQNILDVIHGEIKDNLRKLFTNEVKDKINLI